MDKKTILEKIFQGKEKAWASALMGFLLPFVLQQLGVGDGPSVTDVGGVTDVVSQLGTNLASAVVFFFTTWVTANTGPKATVEVPVEAVPVKPLKVFPEEEKVIFSDHPIQENPGS